MRSITNKIILILLLITCANLASDSNNNDIVKIICEDVTDHFADKYKIHPEDIEVKFKRLPTEINNSKEFQFKLRKSKKDYQPGYQTIWVEAFKSNQFQMKFPVSFEVSISRRVVISKKKINRGQKLNDELVQLRKMKINTKLENLLAMEANLNDYESAKYIKPNTILTKKMVRIPPTLKRGDNVEIRLKSGNIFISTPGIAKEDGYLGEEIRVICQNSRKKLKGVVQSEKSILVINNGY